MSRESLWSDRAARCSIFAAILAWTLVVFIGACKFGPRGAPTWQHSLVVVVLYVPASVFRKPRWQGALDLAFVSFLAWLALKLAPTSVAAAVPCILMIGWYMDLAIGRLYRNTTDTGWVGPYLTCFVIGGVLMFGAPVWRSLSGIPEIAYEPHELVFVGLGMTMFVLAFFAEVARYVPKATNRRPV